jgi:hypothetical protein
MMVTAREKRLAPLRTPTGLSEEATRDISAALTDMPLHQAKPLFEQYVRDLQRAFAYFPEARRKTMFGTDYAGEHTYLNQVEPYLRAVRKVFAKEDQARVFGGLAEELFFDRGPHHQDFTV